MTRYSRIRTQLPRMPIALAIGTGRSLAGGSFGNKLLQISAAGNFSFTRIVNHTREALRRGKNPGGRASVTRRVRRVAYRDSLM